MSVTRLVPDVAEEVAVALHESLQRRPQIEPNALPLSA
jgi:hypothetical protein